MVWTGSMEGEPTVDCELRFALGLSRAMETARREGVKLCPRTLRSRQSAVDVCERMRGSLYSSRDLSDSQPSRHEPGDRSTLCFDRGQRRSRRRVRYRNRRFQERFGIAERLEHAQWIQKGAAD